MADKGNPYLFQTRRRILSVFVATGLALSAPANELNQTLTSDRSERKKTGADRTYEPKKKPKNIATPDSEDVVPLLGDEDEANRQYIEQALKRIPLDLRSSIPHLTKLADDQNSEIRLSAVVALRTYRAKANEALPILKKLLKDPDSVVFNETLLTIRTSGVDVRPVIGELVGLLSDYEAHIIIRSIRALGEFGPEARASISKLQQLAQNEDLNIRIAAIEALRNIEPRLAVPHLIALLNNRSAFVRVNAIRELRSIGPEAKTAIPDLLKLVSSSDTIRTQDVSLNVITAVVRIAPETNDVISFLTQLLNDRSELISREAAHALIDLSDRSLQDEAVSTINLLQTAYESMTVSPDSEIRTQAAELKIRLDRLRALRLKRFWFFVAEHPIWTLIVGLYFFFVLLSLLTRSVFPLLFLYINENLGDVRVPKFLPLIGPFDLPLRYVFAIGLFTYRPHVLDAWVAYHIETAQRSFSQRDTVKARQEHIPLPILLDGERVENYKIGDFQTIFSHNLNCLLIRGEGGSGKTSLACLLATWAMNEKKDERLRPKHRMLPVLIDHTLNFGTSTDSEKLLKVINNQIKRLLDLRYAPSSKLLGLLLTYGHILFVVDAFSEMEKTVRETILTTINEIPIGAVIVTSRNDEVLGGVRKNIIRLLELSGSQVPTFIEGYLKNRKKSHLFEDEALMEVSRRLMLIVGSSGITTVLAKYYVELRIAREENVVSDLPSNIPDLMQRYIDIIHHDRSSETPSTEEIHNVAEIAAWCCLRRTFRAASADYKDILAALGKRGNGFTALAYLREPLRLIQADGNSYTRIRFVLDPLAEYLAGLYIIKKCGARTDLWEEFLSRADEQEGAPKAIRAFLLAVQDCCLSKGAEIQIPDFVNAELTKRVMMALVQDLESSEPDVRAQAAKFLSDMKQDAIRAIPALRAVLSDEDDCVRQSAANAIAKILHYKKHSS